MPQITTYGLSNRQRKELERGTRLRIAIPAPAGESDLDPRVWFCESVPEIDPRSIVIVEEFGMPVSPLQKEAGDGLGSILGKIVHDDEPLPVLCVEIWCVVAELQERRVSKARAQTQWAGRVIYPGD